MVARLRLGYHSGFGKMGIWLTKSGLDVNSVSEVPANFLLMTDYKTEQVIVAGSIYVGAGGSGVVYFPVTLPSAPYVSFNMTHPDGNNYYPFYVALDQTQFGQAYTSTGSVTFVNNGPYNSIFYYRVLARALGS